MTDIHKIFNKFEGYISVQTEQENTQKTIIISHYKTFIIFNYQDDTRESTRFVRDYYRYFDEEILAFGPDRFLRKQQNINSSTIIYTKVE